MRKTLIFDLIIGSMTKDDSPVGLIVKLKWSATKNWKNIMAKNNLAIFLI